VFRVENAPPTSSLDLSSFAAGDLMDVELLPESGQLK
jgi:hypothetical protein